MPQSGQGQGVPGKIQLGSGWWFCDHKDGMEQQMKTLRQQSMQQTVGMAMQELRSTTDIEDNRYIFF